MTWKKQAPGWKCANNICRNGRKLLLDVDRKAQGEAGGPVVDAWGEWQARVRRELPAGLPELLTDTGGLAEVRRLEAELGQVHGVPFALGLSSGTAALEAALFALHVGPGDEVICPALAPAYAILPVLNAGATPAWCDVERDTLALARFFRRVLA